LAYLAAYFFTKTSRAACAAARSDAVQISRRSFFIAGWTDLATLFSRLAVLWTQQRWCRVVGKASSSALQNPSAPSATASSGAMARPRAWMSISNSRQLRALSRTPTWKPISSFLPSGVAPMITSMHSAVGSKRAWR